jgi:hypothetical protein
MSISTRVKAPFKTLRWRARRAAAARRWGAERLAAMPVVIGNAMPKSGSHLLIQVLLGLTDIGPFVDPGLPPLTRSAENQNLSEAEVLARLNEMQPGDIAYSYLQTRAPYLEALSLPSVAAFFVYRDPRDVIVSQIFYAMDMHAGHGMRAYYQKLPDMEARVDAAIRGVQSADASLSPIRTKYEKYLGWLEQKAVLSLRFEDLILDRQTAIARMLDHLQARGFAPQPPRPEAVAALEASIAPRASGTFRKGQPGEWRQHFSPTNIAAFKDATGDLLQRLGYEMSAQW